MAPKSLTHTHYRTREQIAADLAYVWHAPVSAGTKAAVAHDAFWTFSEHDGKFDGCAHWSIAARKLAKQRSQLRHEHAVPRNVLLRMLGERDAWDAQSMLAFLTMYCIGAVVTRDEDLALNRAGLRQRMPDGWDGVDVWARYKVAQISMKP